jgi:crotonobetainyl-CoA:carnitine CoA-transferase CaiB-like acyl-CoA transferase
MADAALSHLRVLELAEGIAGPYCTKLMAGFGAEVIKVERPITGDRTRASGPFSENQPGAERSIPFLWLNTGKKSITLDASRPEGIAAIKDLVQLIEVVVIDWSPRSRATAGLDHSALLAVNPQLVVVSVTPFGLTGPYRDFEADEITYYAMSGSMYVTGDPARAPLVTRPAICQYTAGMHAYIAALLALFRRTKTGEGEHVDLSIQESAMENIEVVLAEQLHANKTAKRRNDEHVLVPWQIHPCKDGYAAIVGGPMRNWLKAVDLFEEPLLLTDKYRHMARRMQHRDEVASLMRPWLSRHTREEVYRIGQAGGLAFGFLASLDEAFHSPQHKGRDFLVSIDHPVVGKHRYCGPPFRLAEAWRSERAPLLGEHNNEILGRLGRQRSSVTARDKPATKERSHQPLAGIRIVDLTHDWAGPHATRLLADYGAEVIKIECIKRLDAMRGGRKENQAYNHHPRWHQINRNKRSITLNLNAPRDLQIFRELVKRSDIVVENSRVGVMKRFGADYESLRQLKPDLIYLSMSAFGQTGPEAGRAGYGGTIEAVAGIQSLTAYDATSRPMRIKEMDVTNGILGACALMTALIDRQRTGRGQWIDLSEQEAATAGLVGELMLEHAMNGTRFVPQGNRHRRYAPQGCYRCAREDQWVTLVVRSDAEWLKLCDVIGQPGLGSDARFRTEGGRAQNHDALDQIMERWTAARTHIEAMTQLQIVRIAAGAVLTAAELMADPHLEERAFFLSANDGSGSRYPGLPFQLSAGGGEIHRRGPDLGADNEYVVCELLGHSRDDVEPVRDAEIITAFDVQQ